MPESLLKCHRILEHLKRSSFQQQIRIRSKFVVSIVSKPESDDRGIPLMFLSVPGAMCSLVTATQCSSDLSSSPASGPGGHPVLFRPVVFSCKWTR